MANGKRGKNKKNENFVYSESGLGTLLIYSKKLGKNIAEYFKSGEAIFLTDLEEQPTSEDVENELKKIRKNS